METTEKNNSEDEASQTQPRCKAGPPLTYRVPVVFEKVSAEKPEEGQ